MDTTKSNQAMVFRKTATPAITAAHTPAFFKNPFRRFEAEH